MEYKKYSKDSLYSYSFGAFPTYELLKNKNIPVDSIILHEKLEKSKDLENILKLAKSRNIKIITNGKLIEKLSSKGNIYIVGVFKKYDMNIDNSKNQVLLVNPSDMGNLGTIIRVMLGFNYTNLAIIKPCIDIFDPKVIRASMGAIFNTNIELFDSIEDYLKVNTNEKYPFMLKGKTYLQNTTQKKTPHTLIFGNEATGLNDSYLNIGTPIKINHSANIDSLNLSMSVGIALYEFSK
jgi:TrmH family RNA methyltransferase